MKYENKNQIIKIFFRKNVRTSLGTLKLLQELLKRTKKRHNFLFKNLLTVV